MWWWYSIYVHYFLHTRRGSPSVSHARVPNCRLRWAVCGSFHLNKIALHYNSPHARKKTGSLTCVWQLSTNILV